MSIDQPSSIEDVLISVSQIFSKNKIRFCLAGGWAVGIWGAVRATEDIDLIVLMEDDNGKKIESVLSGSYKVLQHKNMMLEKTGTPLWRHILTSDSINDHCILDIIPAGSNFLKNALNRCISVQFKDILLPIISIEDLILMKLMAGRNQDIQDVRSLLSGNMPVDKNYFIETARRMGIDIDAFL